MFPPTRNDVRPIDRPGRNQIADLRPSSARTVRNDVNETRTRRVRHLQNAEVSPPPPSHLHALNGRCTRNDHREAIRRRSVLSRRHATIRHRNVPSRRHATIRRRNVPIRRHATIRRRSVPIRRHGTIRRRSVPSPRRATTHRRDPSRRHVMIHPRRLSRSANRRT